MEEIPTADSKEDTEAWPEYAQVEREAGRREVIGSSQQSRTAIVDGSYDR